jgi:hypothetical protein
MPDYVHLILAPKPEDGLGSAVGEAHRHYTNFINARAGLRLVCWNLLLLAVGFFSFRRAKVMVEPIQCLFDHFGIRKIVTRFVDDSALVCGGSTQQAEHRFL